MGKHLTYEQRCQLHALYQQGMKQEAIAAKIGSNLGGQPRAEPEPRAAWL